MEDKYYSTEEVASILGYAKRTVLGFVQQGLLRPENIRYGRSYMFSGYEVTRFARAYQPKMGWPKGQPAPPGRGWPKGKRRV